MVLIFFKNATRMLTIISGNYFMENNVVSGFKLTIQYTTIDLHT